MVAKPGCHLCDEARVIVHSVLGEHFPLDDVRFTETSILDDDGLRATYGEEIPVILINGAMHSYWFVDPNRLRAAVDTALAG